MELNAKYYENLHGLAHSVILGGSHFFDAGTGALEFLMAGAFNSPQHKRRPAVNVTPLIDVMFLLLIFFMVSSTFREDLAIDITLPKAESAASQDVTAKEIVVDRAGVTYFEGRPISEQELREALGAVLADDPRATLVLRADDRADFGRVLRVIDIARDLHVENLIIPTDPLESSPDRR